MKKIITLFALLMAIATSQAQDIQLPAPQTKGGLPVNEALAVRRSVREFDSSRALSLQTISDLLWATCGISSPEDGKRTNPTAVNRQEIDAYWFDANGVYLYDFKNNKLVEMVKGDKRSLVAGNSEFTQDFVMQAPESVVLVVNGTKIPESRHAAVMALIDAGIACENLNLFCAGNGLATVPRASMDIDGINKLLSLPANSFAVLNNPVGYPAK